MESVMTTAHTPPRLPHPQVCEKTPEHVVSPLRGVFADVVASVVGSAACVYTGQPFDTIKVRIQLSQSQSTPLIATIKQSISANGVAALWRGSTPAFLGSLLENGMAFATNGVVKRLFGLEEGDQTVDNGDSSLWKHFASGTVTGALTAFVLCPCDVTKCRAQASIAMGGAYNGMRPLIADIIKSRGVAGLYQGFGPQMTRDVAFYAAFFGGYQTFTDLLKKHTDLPDTAVYFLAGGFAGQLGWLTSIIPDTIKSRVQTSDVNVGFVRTAKDILRVNGWRGFFAGVEVALIRAFPANAALFVGYELTRELLE